MTTLKGGCYCGNISMSVQSDTSLTATTPRACQCAFCLSHGAEWVSIPDAALEIEVQNEAAINIYAQGSESARFWLCQRCGVVAAVTCDIDGKRKGAVNRRAMDVRDTFPKADKTDPTALSAAEKKDRWQALWIKDVVIKDCWDVGL